MWAKPKDPVACPGLHVPHGESQTDSLLNYWLPHSAVRLNACWDPLLQSYILSLNVYQREEVDALLTALSAGHIHNAELKTFLTSA